MKGVQFFDDLIAKVLRYLAINRVLNCQALPIVSQFHDLQSINVRLKSSTLEKNTYKKKKATQEVVHLHGAGSGEFLSIAFAPLTAATEFSHFLKSRQTYSCNGKLGTLMGS